MNKEQIEGTAKDLAGKAQEAVGKVLNDKELQVKGLQKQIAGNAEKSLGDVKQTVTDIRDALKKAGK